MLLGQELKFKNKLCNLKLGTFFSALPGLGASALSGRAASGAGLQGVLLLEFLGLQGVLEPHAKVQTLFKKGIKKD